MEITGNSIIGNLVGEVKCANPQPDMQLVEEVEALMAKYKIDYMWFAWSKFGGENET